MNQKRNFKLTRRVTCLIIAICLLLCVAAYGYAPQSDSMSTDEPILTLYEDGIRQLLKGAALMAAGGGGSLELGEGMLDAFKELNPDVEVKIDLYDVNAMQDSESSFGVAIMGSPTAHASVEDLASIALMAYQETLALAERSGKNAEYALALELGGANTLVPLLCAMKYGLKVLDADMCGRAVPGLETSLSNVNGLATAPLALTDAKGNSYDLIMADPNDAEGAESVAVAILNHLNSNGGLTGFYYSGAEIDAGIPTGSLSLCVQIGQCIEEFEAMSIEERQAKPLFEMLNEMNVGIRSVTLTPRASNVQNFHQEPIAGGARDGGYYYLGVEGVPGEYFYVQFNNETMAVSVLNESGTFDCLATAPCVITMYDELTGRPLTNADLKTAYENGTEHKVVMGIIELDEKWWNNPDKVAEVWTPYFEEVGHMGGVVRYEFD